MTNVTAWPGEGGRGGRPRRPAPPASSSASELSPPWTVEHRTGPAADLLSAGLQAGGAGEPGDRPLRTVRTVRIVAPEAPALILGSAQGVGAADLEACAAAGVDVVRRSSGGGAVLVRPGRVLWVDVVVPAGDPLWEADVGRAFLWLGEAWAAALRAVVALPDRSAQSGAASGAGGVRGAEDPPGPPPVGASSRPAKYEVHRGPPQSTPWSRMVCFAGLGQGEVTVAGRKVVGISQRRTRAGALFQSAVHLLAGPPDGVARDVDAPSAPAAARSAGVAEVADLVAVGPGERGALREHLERSVAAVTAGADALASALVAALP